MKESLNSLISITFIIMVGVLIFKGCENYHIRKMAELEFRKLENK